MQALYWAPINLWTWPNKIASWILEVKAYGLRNLEGSRPVSVKGSAQARAWVTCDRALVALPGFESGVAQCTHSELWLSSQFSRQEDISCQSHPFKQNSNFRLFLWTLEWDLHHLKLRFYRKVAPFRGSDIQDNISKYLLVTSKVALGVLVDTNWLSVCSGMKPNRPNWIKIERQIGK